MFYLFLFALRRPGSNPGRIARGCSYISGDRPETEPAASEPGRLAARSLKFVLRCQQKLNHSAATDFSMGCFCWTPTSAPEGAEGACALHCRKKKFKTSLWQRSIGGVPQDERGDRRDQKKAEERRLISCSSTLTATGRVVEQTLEYRLNKQFFFLLNILHSLHGSYFRRCCVTQFMSFFFWG